MSGYVEQHGCLCYYPTSNMVKMWSCKLRDQAISENDNVFKSLLFKSRTGRDRVSWRKYVVTKSWKWLDGTPSILDLSPNDPLLSTYY